MNDPVFLKTADEVTIVGDYYEGGGERAALLLHMMPSTRASWAAFANHLVEAGISALAIDLRGHGDSMESSSGKLDYKNFRPEEHQASIHDVDAAIEWLRREKKMKQISIAGASIGANLALSYGAEHPEIKSLALLSPGLDYQGVNAETAAAKLSPSQRVFFLASADDEYSAASIQELFQKTLSQEKKMELFQDAGHGTTMLERKPEYLKILADWIAAGR